MIAAFDALDAAAEQIASLPFDALTAPEHLSLLDRLERHRRRLPAVEHRLIGGLRAQAQPAALGAKNWTQVLRSRLRISTATARRRLADADALGPRHTVTGEQLEPLWPALARAQAAGLVDGEHVGIVRKFFTHLPEAVDFATRVSCEQDLARIAARFDPEGLDHTVTRLSALLDPDGPEPDLERDRTRGITVGPQGPDGMSRITGRLTPEARALWEVLDAKLAAPGMCNPADNCPRVEGTPTQEQITADTRTPAQRGHDAFVAAGRAVLASKKLGTLNGLPVTVIVSTTLQDLESGAGHAVTGGGSLLPMRDLIKMAAHAHHYLAVFDEHTHQPLYLGRTQRLASPAQRIMLHARDRGCTMPGCTVSGYRSQVHHLTDWAAGGRTDITNLTLACPGDNRLAGPGGYTTTLRKGRPHWTPPPHLDAGQPRTNNYHHPQHLLRPQDHNEDDDEDR